MQYGRTIEMDADFNEVVAKVKTAFAEQGFGTVTEIDMRSTLRAKIGAEIEPYVILGACNPRLAHHAIETEPLIGLLLPCNVVVRRADGRTMVHALEPRIMAEVAGNQDLGPVADEASRMIDAALESLTRAGANA